MSDVSKIRLSDGSEYDIKDAELRHMMNVLLGKEPDNESSKETKED